MAAQPCSTQVPGGRFSRRPGWAPTRPNSWLTNRQRFAKRAARPPSPRRPRRSARERGLQDPRGTGRGELVQLDRPIEADGAARLEHLVLLERDVVAHVVVEQVLALEADGHLRYQAALVVELERVGEVGADQRVALGRRLVLPDPVLVEGMQEAQAGEPIEVAIVDAGTRAMRGNARDIAALGVVEPGVGEVVAGVDAPHAAPEAGEVVLAEQLQAVEAGVALPVADLIELRATAARRAARQRGVALLARQLLEDEAIESGVIGRGVEPERALGLPEAELERAGGLFLEERVADLEGAGGPGHALGEQLRIGRGALHVLRGEPRDHAPRQFVEGAGTGAEGSEGALPGDERRVHRIGQVKAGAVDLGLLNTRRGLQAQLLRH